MPNYICYLLLLLTPDKRLMRVAIKVHRDDEDRLADDPVSFLPLHHQDCTFLEEQKISDVVDKMTYGSKGTDQ